MQRSQRARRAIVFGNFKHIAEQKNLPFLVEFDPGLPRAITTDPKRLQQILKNLLSNAFKFTAQGGVRFNVLAAQSGWNADHPVLKQSATVVAFEVSDTGIGITLWTSRHEWQRRRQPPVDRERLPVDIGRLVRRQERQHPRHARRR